MCVSYVEFHTACCVLRYVPQLYKRPTEKETLKCDLLGVYFIAGRVADVVEPGPGDRFQGC